jgi:hypothetical protein
VPSRTPVCPFLTLAGIFPQLSEPHKQASFLGKNRTSWPSWLRRTTVSHLNGRHRKIESSTLSEVVRFFSFHACQTSSLGWYRGHIYFDILSSITRCTIVGTVAHQRIRSWSYVQATHHYQPLSITRSH